MTLSSLINNMRKAEILVGDVYRLYSARFPEHAGFWERLADEETEHARLFSLISKLIEDESIFFENMDNTAKATDKLLKSLRSLKKDIENKKNNLSMRKALKSALDIELSVGEHEQFKGLRTSLDSVRSYMNRIAAANRAHVQLIVEEIKKVEGDTRLT